MFLLERPQVVSLCDKSLAPHRVRIPKKAKHHAGKPQLLSQRNNTLPLLLEGLSKEGHQPHGLEVLLSTLRKKEQVAEESYRLRGARYCPGCKGHITRHQE